MSMILINLEAANRLGVISQYKPVMLPLSIGLLAGYLLKRGKTVKVIDEQITPLDEHLVAVRQLVKDIPSPHIFGISCLTLTIQKGLIVAKWLKEAYPEAKIIFGGVHPTTLPEEVLRSPYADIVVRGEGEETLCKLYDAIKNGKDYEDISGISFKKNGRIRHNPDKEPVDDLDTISYFGYEVFDLWRYHSSVGMILSSRGCPYGCIFCSQRKVSGRKYRFRSIAGIIEEIVTMVKKYGRKQIVIVDDDFLVDSNRVEGICMEIIKNRLPSLVTFACQARGNHIDKKLLPLLKEAGFRNVAIGMETGSERLMRIIDKDITVAQNIKAVEALRAHGIAVTGYFLYGIPSETAEERLETYELARRLGLRIAEFSAMVPYPGTKMFDIARTEERLIVEEGWSNFNPAISCHGTFLQYQKLPYVPRTSTERALRNDLVRANLFFHLFRLTPVRLFLKKERVQWFELRKDLFYDHRCYIYFLKIALFIIVNLIVTFDARWLAKEIELHRFLVRRSPDT